MRRVRHAAHDAAFALGWSNPNRVFQGFGQRILTYHGIDRAGRLDLNARFVSAAVFEQHIRYLSDHANVLSLDDYFLQKFDNQRFNIAITFDDGYRNNLELALPILEKYRIPATFFITPAHLIGQDALWMDVLDVATALGPKVLAIGDTTFYKKKWRHTRYYADANGQKLVDKARYGTPQFAKKMMDELRRIGTTEQWKEMGEYWQLLDQQQIIQLADSPWVSIGAHGLAHLDFARATPNDLTTELVHAKKLLETTIGKPVHQLAFPYGAYSPTVVAQARAAGFTQQYAIDFLANADCDHTDLRERMVINPYISANNQWLAVRHGRY